MEISINSGCLQFLQDDKRIVALLERQALQRTTIERDYL